MVYNVGAETLFGEKTMKETKVLDSKTRSVSDRFEEILRRVPAEQVRRLPRDGAEKHDRYIYGNPRKQR